MTLPIYATRGDVTRFGLPAAALVVSPRSLVSVDISGDTLTLEAHGLDAGTPVQFIGDDLPAPLSRSTAYYVLLVPGSDDLLQVSATLNGSPINLTTGGTAPVGLKASIGPMLDALLERRSRYIDEALTAHRSPLSAPYPSLVVGWVAQLVANDLARILGLGNSNYAESVLAIREAAAAVDRELAPYRVGKPLDELAVDATPTISDNAAVGWGDSPRDWEHASNGASFL